MTILALAAIGARGENKVKAFRAGTLAMHANCDVVMYVNFKQAAAVQERIEGINLLTHPETRTSTVVKGRRTRNMETDLLWVFVVQ